MRLARVNWILHYYCLTESNDLKKSRHERHIKEDSPHNNEIRVIGKRKYAQLIEKSDDKHYEPTSRKSQLSFFPSVLSSVQKFKENICSKPSSCYSDDTQCASERNSSRVATSVSIRNDRMIEIRTSIMQVGEMEYSVVEFTDADGGGLALVNCKWFTPQKKEVFWPPYKNPSLFNKALKNGESPEISWKSYSIKRNYYQSSNYDAARKKLKLAEDTSDLQSDNSEQPIKKARIKRPPKRLYLNSSDESNLEEDCNENRPPRFEPIVVSTCNLDNTLEDRAPQSCSSVLNPLNGTATHLNENVLNSPATSNSSTVTYHSELFTPNSQSSINRNLQPFSDSRLLDKLFTDVEILKQQNKQIISLLESKAPKLLLSLPGDIPVPLPLGSVEDLKKFEDYLTEKSHLDSLVRLRAKRKPKLHVEIRQMYRRTACNLDDLCKINNTTTATVEIDPIFVESDSNYETPNFIVDNYTELDYSNVDDNTVICCERSINEILNGDKDRAFCDIETDNVLKINALLINLLTSKEQIIKLQTELLQSKDNHIKDLNKKINSLEDRKTNATLSPYVETHKVSANKQQKVPKLYSEVSKHQSQLKKGQVNTNARIAQIQEQVVISPTPEEIDSKNCLQTIINLNSDINTNSVHESNKDDDHFKLVTYQKPQNKLVNTYKTKPIIDMADGAGDLPTPITKTCKKCKNYAQSGLECVKCQTVSHVSCVKLLKNVIKIDDKFINCCGNVDNNLKMEYTGIVQKNIVGENYNLNLEISHLREILKHKDEIISNQKTAIHALQEQVCLLNIVNKTTSLNRTLELNQNPTLNSTNSAISVTKKSKLPTNIETDKAVSIEKVNVIPINVNKQTTYVDVLKDNINPDVASNKKQPKIEEDNTKVCHQCGHVFTRSDNLKRHLQNSCKGVAKTPNDEVKKRKFEDGGESSSKKKIDDNKQEVIVNVRCNECQEDVLKAHYRGHLRSNRHKINACRFIDDEGESLIDYGYRIRTNLAKLIAKINLSDITYKSIRQEIATSNALDRFLVTIPYQIAMQTRARKLTTLEQAITYAQDEINFAE
ncbi:hypothetical protein RN001_002094 [Aquatica leii]|uniref:C2H2-type domain-containing protein n=1 Tax=Aquatica leii TaxID=1421715 RepID=A0AAN7SR44_9COLE|nr:hypothetical protein RN001_002094 [Aquatica leii]